MHEHFAQRFCIHFDLPDHHYRDDLLRRTLHPHARLLYPFITWLDYEFFDADRDFVAGVGCLGRRSDFAGEVADFLTHRRSGNLLRRFLYVRISIARMQELVDTVFATSPEEN